MALQITITDAGRAEIINAQNTGTDPVVIAEIGLGTGQYVPAESQTALVAEFKRLTTFGGTVVAADTISIAIRDDSADVYEVSEFGLYTASGTLLAVYSVVGTPFFDKAAQSILLLAVDIKLTTLDAAALTFGDINFVNPPATETVMGVAELATAAEVQTGTDTERIVTPAGLSSRTATTTRTGLVELATDAEGQTGTDTARAVTPAVMRADSATANTANRVVRRGASGQIAVGAITADGNISGVEGTFTGAVSVQNLTYSGSLTGSAGVINIGSGQITKDASGRVGLGASSTNDLLTVNGSIKALAATANGNTTGAVLDYDTANGAARVLSYRAAGSEFQVFTNTSGGNLTKKFTVNRVGNTGINADPSDWQSNFRALEIGSRLAVYQSGAGTVTLGNNFYNDAAGLNRYKTTARVGALSLIGGGGLDYSTAAQGTAGTEITFTSVFAVSDAGAARADGFINADYTAASTRIRARNQFRQNNAGSTALTTGWIAAAFGDEQSNRFVTGQSSEGAIIGGHVGALNAWAPLFINPNAVAAARVIIGTFTDDGTTKLQVAGEASVSTPAQFANDTKVATSAFVQRALGNYSDVRILTANTVLTAADVGKYIFINANNISVTLPNPSTLPLGATITIVQSVTTSGAQIVAPGGVTMNGVMTGSTSSPIVMQNKAEYEIVAVTSSAYQVAMFGGTASLGTSGYQFLPSGLIVQWTQVSLTAVDIDEIFSFTWPISFNTVYSAYTGHFASVVDADYALQLSSLTTTGGGIRASVFNSAFARGNSTAYVIGIGI